MARRFKNEPIKTVSAWAQARSARVPLVVVMTIVLPRTFSGRNSRGELLKSLQRYLAPRKIKPPQRLHDPDVHRKRVLISVSKKQNAIGNFSAHTRQPYQRISRIADRHRRQPAQIHRAASNHLRRSAQ